MKKTFIVGNWKMKKTIAESLDFIKVLREERNIDRISNVDIVLTPSFVALAPVNEACQGSVIKMGAQNAFYEQIGAFCGEISPRLLKEVCTYVFVGHSERRTLFGDTDVTVNKRVLACLEEELIPILCIGETFEEYTAGHTHQVLNDQLSVSLQSVQNVTDIIILYEPVWALGTGEKLPAGQANEIARYIRAVIEALYDLQQSKAVRIIYAGSINEDNALSYVSESDIDGLALGTASLHVDQFFSIIDRVSKKGLNQ